MTDAEQALRSVLTAATAACDADVRAVRFGPIPMTVACDDPALAGSVAAHAADGDARASWDPLTVLLCTGTGLPRSSLPEPLRPGPWPGPTTLFHAGPLTAMVSDRMLWVVDAETSTALRWSDDADDIPIWEANRPLRFALRWWAARHDGALLHAAAVAMEGRAALLVGAGGAGKSTTAFACLGSSLDVLGDDYCLVQAAEDGTAAVAHATYRLGNLTEKSLALLPQLRDRVVGPAPQSKSLLTLDPLTPEAAHAVVVALCGVTQSPGETTRVLPESAALALRRLGPSTVSQIPGSNEETWRVTARVARSTPAYELRVGRLSEAPAVLAELLTRDAA